MKLWGGRFRHQTAAEMEEFNSSIQFDHRLWQEDIDGSLAHVKMLAAVGVLSAAEADTIGRGLAEIRAEIEQGQFDFSPELEDIHMHIEHRLMEKIGPVGGKVHTARSRNDQVALDTHLYVRRQVDKVLDLIAALQRELIQQAEKRLDGMQVIPCSMPNRCCWLIIAGLCSLCCSAIVSALDCRERADLMPLGAGALAEPGFPLIGSWWLRNWGSRPCTKTA